MNNEYEHITNLLDQFINQKCIRAGLAPSGIMWLFFGRITKGSKIKDGSNKGKISVYTEYILYFDWRWRILNKQKILLSYFKDDEKKTMYIKYHLTEIIGNKILEYKYHKSTNDLELIFENGFVLQTFNDIILTPENEDLRNREIFTAYTPNQNLEAHADGEIIFEKYKVKYVNDYETNPEKYYFPWQS